MNNIRLDQLPPEKVEEARREGFSTWEKKEAPYTIFAPPIQSVLVKAQNVYDYAKKHQIENGWDDLANFKCCRLPFSRLVISYDVIGDIAVHFDVMLGELETSKIIDWLTGNRLDTEKSIASVKMLKDLNPYRIMAVKFAAEGNDIGVFAMLAIDEAGQVLIGPNDIAFILNARYDHWGQPGDWEMLEAMAGEGIMVGLATVNFMNCKNVEVIDNPPTRQQRRHAEREGKRPPVTYKTLRILPFGRAARKQAQHFVEPGTAMPLHICRGHFKDYRQGSGLGKFHRHGLWWWWAAQVRGAIERGRVVKDYEVKP